MTHPDHIYCKSQKGHVAIASRTRDLDFRHRRSLIVMNGIESLGVIAKTIPMEELQQTVPFLMHNGFIVLSTTQVNASATNANLIHSTTVARTSDTSIDNEAIHAPLVIPSITQRTESFTQSPAAIATTKEFMINNANTHLGLMSADIITRVQRCHTAEQLMAAAGFWHMAMRESKTGNGVAGEMLSQVKRELRQNQNVVH